MKKSKTEIKHEEGSGNVFAHMSVMAGSICAR